MDRENHRNRPARPDEINAGRAVVAMRVPARPEYVAMLRAACGQLAPQLGCTRSETADLQLAVDEASGFLLCNCIAPREGGEHDALSATFVIEGRNLHITVARQAAVFVSPDDHEFGWTFLAALVDEFACRVEGRVVLVEIGKSTRMGGRNEHTDRGERRGTRSGAIRGARRFVPSAHAVQR